MELKQHVPFLVLLGLYLIVQLYFLVSHPGSIYNEPERVGEGIATYGSRDASLYAKMAWQLLHEGIYAYNEEQSNAYVTYGQPFYLAGIFQVAEWLNTNHLMLYRLSNMVLNTLVVVLTYVIGMKLFNSRTVSFFGALLYCTYIAPYHYFRAALTEIPSLFLFMLTIFIFILALEKKTYRYHILFGLVASLLLMFRATPAPILLFAWGIMLVRTGFKESVKIGFIWCVGPLVLMTPWVVRNFLMFGEAYLFSSHAGSPLLLGTRPFFLEGEAEVVQQAKALGLSLEDYGKQRIAEGFSTDFILYFSWFTVGKTMWLFMTTQLMPDGLGPYINDFSKTVFEFFKWHNVFTAASGLLFAFLFRKHRPLTYLSIVLLIYIFFSNIFLAIPRYGFIVYPIVCLIAAYGWVYIYRSAKKSIKYHKNPQHPVSS